MKKLLEWAELFFHCFRPALLLCALVLSFAVAQLQAVTTVYVGKHFEVRDHHAPVKYVFNGQTRVARITGSLSTNERIQRLRLRAGWNLVSVAVTAPDFLDQLRESTSGPAPVIQALYRWQPATSDYGTIASGESVTAGTVLWLSAQADAVVAVRGAYVDVTEWRAPASGTFVAVPALEAQPLRLPMGVTVWRYDAQNRRWQAGLTGDLASLSDLPPTLAPGEAIYVHSNEPADLGVPAPEERIRYYHQDHLGSSSVTTDANGALFEETAFYPFGIPRHEHRLRQIEEAYQFTQKERDRENGLHYFETRYLAGGLSRFVSPDRKYANPDALGDELESFLSSPQEINLYAYVVNDPVNFVDPLGESPRPHYRGRVNVPAYEPARPPGPLPSPPSRPPVPAAPAPPAPSPAPVTPRPVTPLRPPPPLEFPLKFQPTPQPHILPPGGGTSLPPRPPVVVRVGGILLAFQAGVAVGTFIDDKVGISNIAADTGHKVKEAYRDAGLPNFMAEASGLATTFTVANGGFLGVFLSEIVNDDD